jgi:hypothetical protein
VGVGTGLRERLPDDIGQSFIAYLLDLYDFLVASDVASQRFAPVGICARPSEGNMKALMKLEAIIKSDRLDAVKSALIALDLGGMTISQV